MRKSLFSLLLENLRGNRSKIRRHPREVRRGDVVCVELVEDGILKRYGICTGRNVILYSTNPSGIRIVHEVSFADFVQRAKYLSICEFPKEYGRPLEWEQSIPCMDVVTPPDGIYDILGCMRKSSRYRLYSRPETDQRAESRIGTGGYGNSESFAVWCKTGIAESHEVNALRPLLDHLIVY